MYSNNIKINEFYEKQNVLYELIYRDLNICIVVEYPIEMIAVKEEVTIPIKIVKNDFFNKEYSKVDDEKRQTSLTLKQKQIIIRKVFNNINDVQNEIR